MNFPTTPVLDDFNRANGGLGANWASPADPVGPNTPTIDTNVVIGPSGVFSSAYYSAETFGPDADGHCSLPGASFVSVALMTRIQNPGLGTYCSYYCDFDSAAGIRFSRNYNNANSGVLKTVALNAAAGWKIGLRTITVVGNIWNQFWVNKGGANGWEQAGEYTDVGAVAAFPLLANDGYIGFVQWGNGTTTRSIDDFGGGTARGVIDRPSFTDYPKPHMRSAA